MEKTNSINLEKYEQYEKNGLIRFQQHPYLNLLIWNYTSKTQFLRLWDETTLMCRALVTDNKGNIISRNFSKFFNLEEEKEIPNEPYEIYEKLDGSLIVAFWYKNELVVSSKGSFVSHHSVQAKRLLNNYDLSVCDTSKTYCFELIAPWNRIVCSYPKEELFLLAKFDNFGNEYSIINYKNFPLVKKYDHINVSEIKDSVTDDREGVVVRFKSGKRIKIKGKEYVRLHKIVTGLSESSILEILKNNESIEKLLDRVPDEFYNWAKEVESKFKFKYEEILNESKSVFKEFSTRKETALYFLKQKNPQVLFSLLDKKDPSEIIWKLINNEIGNSNQRT